VTLKRDTSIEFRMMIVLEGTPSPRSTASCFGSPRSTPTGDGQLQLQRRVGPKPALSRDVCYIDGRLRIPPMRCVARSNG